MSETTHVASPDELAATMRASGAHVTSSGVWQRGCEVQWTFRPRFVRLEARLMRHLPRRGPLLDEVVAIVNDAEPFAGAALDASGVAFHIHAFRDARGAVPLRAIVDSIEDVARAHARFGPLLERAAAEVAPTPWDRSRTVGLQQLVVASRPILDASRIFEGSDLPCEERSVGWKRPYCGVAVRPAEHPYLHAHDGSPLANAIAAAACEACGSRDVHVLAAQPSFSMGGDAYYDLELRCAACARYTLVSYAEND